MSRAQGAVMAADEAIAPGASLGPVSAGLAGSGAGAGGLSRIRLARLVTASRLLRAAIHVACWVPFITTAVDSWRGPWRAVGDNARLALQSWNTLSGYIPLVGQPNELPNAPHDLGPLQYWLLTIPVHADTDPRSDAMPDHFSPGTGCRRPDWT